MCSYQSGVAPKQWYFDRNLLNKLSAPVFFLDFLLLKSLFCHPKNALYYFLTIPVSNVMYDFPQQIFGKLIALGIRAKAVGHILVHLQALILQASPTQTFDL